MLLTPVRLLRSSAITLLKMVSLSKKARLAVYWAHTASASSYDSFIGTYSQNVLLSKVTLCVAGTAKEVGRMDFVESG